MAQIQHQLKRVWLGPGGQTLSKTETLLADAETNRNVTAYAGQTTIVTFPMDVSELELIYITSNKDVVVTPYDDTDNPLAAINLELNGTNEPVFMWSSGSGLDNPFTDDLSAFRIANAGTADALVSFRSLFDSTVASPVGS